MTGSTVGVASGAGIGLLGGSHVVEGATDGDGSMAMDVDED